MVLITFYNYIVTGAYKPTYNWGGGHIVVLGTIVDIAGRTYKLLSVGTAW